MSEAVGRAGRKADEYVTRNYDPMQIKQVQIMLGIFEDEPADEMLNASMKRVSCEVGDTLIAIDNHFIGGGPGAEEQMVSAGEHVRVVAVHPHSVTVKLVDRTELAREFGRHYREQNVVDLDESDLDHYVDAKVYRKGRNMRYNAIGKPLVRTKGTVQEQIPTLLHQLMLLHDRLYDGDLSEETFRVYLGAPWLQDFKRHIRGLSEMLNDIELGLKDQR